jgi:hypothetical protein
MIEPDLLNANRITENRYFKRPDIALLNVAIVYNNTLPFQDFSVVMDICPSCQNMESLKYKLKL